MNIYPVSTIILDTNEIEKIIELAQMITLSYEGEDGIITESPSEIPELFCIKSKELSIHIPERIQSMLKSFVKNGSETGFLLIKTLEQNLFTIPPTPPDNNHKIGEQTILARIQSLLLNTIAEMISYEGEGYGRLFQDIVPNEKMKNKQTSLGSNQELEIHTEQAFSSLRPDILSLACLRGDLNAFTYILPVQMILDNVTQEEQELLWKPLWKIGIDLSFQQIDSEIHSSSDLEMRCLSNDKLRGPIPILYGSKIDPYLVFDQDLMLGITEEANKLIKKIVTIYYKKRISHNLSSGEIIFVDNRRAVHGRSSFYPKYDGYDRFLIRCFAVTDYERTKYARKENSRMIQRMYS